MRENKDIAAEIEEKLRKKSSDEVFHEEEINQDIETEEKKSEKD